MTRPRSLRSPVALLAFLGLFVPFVALLSGCVRVKPYQREQLSERSMAPNFGDRQDVKFRLHREASRHGIEGGFGEVGGGCGCN